ALLLVNPTDSTPAVIKQGKALYESYCDHCHGATGLGDGKVGQVYKGVTAYTSASVIDKPAGHFFQVITYGKGRMGAHGSQISPEDRWKIVRYVQVLQKQ
ncbi:MAG: cytochrome c, partial [Cyclobacteriaceae bacterium]|nr:cytochrome c [Cyclobacteriaceae bacterium]